jgi:[acyl-carrier-protein] S-malonyltransferase
MLPVSAPFHSSLLAPAARRLREALENIDVHAPRIPVIHNLDAAPRATPQGVRDALVGQADHPVLWSQCVCAIADTGVELFLECGPGKVLAPLAGRIRTGARGIALADRASLDHALSTTRGG